MDDYWKIKIMPTKKEEKFSLTDWLKNHWEIVVLSIIVGSLLIMTVCSLIQLFITLRK